MESILVVTSELNIQTLSDSLEASEVNMEHLAIKSPGFNYEQWIEEMRPQMIVFDAGLDDTLLRWMHKDFTQTVQKYHMSCQFCTINGKLNLPDVMYIDLAEIQEKRK